MPQCKQKGHGSVPSAQQEQRLEWHEAYREYVALMEDRRDRLQKQEPLFGSPYNQDHGIFGCVWTPIRGNPHVALAKFCIKTGARLFEPWSKLLIRGLSAYIGLMQHPCCRATTAWIPIVCI